MLENHTQGMAEASPGWGDRECSPTMGIFFAQFEALESEAAVARPYLNTMLTLHRTLHTSCHTAPARRLLPCGGARLGPKAASGGGARQLSKPWGQSKSPNGSVKVLTIKHIKHFLYHLPEEVHV